MTVTYTPDGGSVVSLAGAESDEADGPLGLEGSTSRSVQQDAVIGAAVPARFARGNQVVEVSFSAKKAHASYEAAHEYWIGHVQAFNSLGTVVITQGSEVMTLTAASVRAQGRTTGATSEWRYQVEGVIA